MRSATNGRRKAPFSSFLVALLVPGLLGLALAQSLPEPVDPLKRPEPEPGKLTFSASLGYVPTGYAALGVDQAKGPYTDQVASHGLSADLALSSPFQRLSPLERGLQAPSPTPRPSAPLPMRPGPTWTRRTPTSFPEWP